MERNSQVTQNSLLGEPRSTGRSELSLPLLASAATLLNSPQVSPANGCAVALPCLFASVAAAALLTVYTISTSLADFAIARPAQHPAPHEHMRSG